ncbi:type II secretion system F family protein [Ramlibacter solisilvae]|uniref:Pilus assembly protein TadB n=1 Tax=Ramlibacter tataouinensis TaxID=94132 RepID=A0A127JX15_9BURK|nr:type II secretion system F family protein [Ramlibacter tataouinensis]AMO24445.1 pilus assembly protein TadB [Ramlibacter tataouinensis]
MNLAGNAFLVMAVLVFVAVLLFLESMYLLWNSYHGPEAKKIKHRLQVLSGNHDKTVQTRLLRQRMLSELPTVERLLGRFPRMHSLDRFILQSGLETTVSKLLLSCVASFVLAWFLIRSQFQFSSVMALLLSLVACALPLMYVAWMRSKRLEKIQRQLPDALDLMTRGLRAGHAFSSALKMTAEEMPEPIAGEFRTVHDEVNYGVSLQQALTHLSDRVPMTDLRYFVVAVLIQRESGGNLTEILGNLSRLIRERLKLYARIRVLSSEGRLSAWVLGLMPFALAALLNAFNPDFMSPMWKDPIGIFITQVMLTMMVFGVLVLIKIVKIRV